MPAAAATAAVSTRTASLSSVTACPSKFTLVMQVNRPSTMRSQIRSFLTPASRAVRAKAIIAPVSASWASATSAGLPHTPAPPVQASHFATCSHWKQNICSVAIDTPFRVAALAAVFQ